MLIEWTKEQLELKASLRPLSKKLNEALLETENDKVFPMDKWNLLAELGILSMPIDMKYGGLGFDVLTMMCILEGLGECCEDNGLSFSAVSHIASTAIPIQRFGTEQQKETYLPGIARGKLIGAHAITEPDSGSDAFNMRTKAVKADGGYIINGSKMFVTNGPIADLIVVYAMTDQSKGTLGGISAFIVKKDQPGLKIGKPIEKMGLTTSPFCELFFDECFVPDDQLLGKEGRGFSIFSYVMNWEVLSCFSVNLGEMKTLINKCIEYARNRKQFGKPIGKHQAIAHKMANMKIDYEAARSLLFKVGWDYAHGKNTNLSLAIAKTFISEAYVRSSLTAIQVFGGYGYTKEYAIEKYLRNAVGGTIYSGSSEIQRNHISMLMGL